MTSLIKRKYRKIYSGFMALLMLVQNFVPALFVFAPPKVLAQDSPTLIGEVDFSINENNEFELYVESDTSVPYLFTYFGENSETEKAILGEATSNKNLASAIEFAGICSTDSVCVEDEVSYGVLTLPKDNFKSDFIVENDELWLVDGHSLTVTTVELNQAYLYPKNNEVKVTFTKLPKNTGSLRIEEVILSEEQVESLGAVSNVAYDITSSMEDGSFEYDLVLPVPEGANEDVQVVYAESIEELESADLNEVEVFIDLSQDKKLLKTKSLDHFTIFVVVNTDDLPQPPVNDLQLVFDNSDIEYSETGGYWRDSSCDVGYGDGETRVRDPHDNGEEYSSEWEFVAPETANYRLAASWSTHNNRTTNAVYTVFDSSDVQLDTASVDQHVVGAGCGGHSGFQNLGIEVSLVEGEIYTVELSNPDKTAGYLMADAIQLTTIEAPSEVWVDDNWIGQVDGTEVTGSLYIGYDAFALIQEAVSQVKEGGIVHVKEGTHLTTGQMVIDKNLTISGDDKETVILKSTTDTSGSNDDSSSWILINEGVEFNLNSVTLDGDSANRKIRRLITSYGVGTIENNIFKNVKYSKYAGRGVVIFGDVLVQNNLFENIQRIGVHIRKAYSGSSIGTGQVLNNTFIGKGNGDWLDYGIEIGASSYAKIEGNTISDARGIASSDGSESAGILVTDYYGVGTKVDINNNILQNNSNGIYVGYSDDDKTEAEIHFNKFIGNTDSGLFTTKDTVVNADKNWWEDASGPSGDGPGSGQAIFGNATYCPWLTSSDLDNPTYGGSCLGYVQGRTFIDQAENGLLLSADVDYPDGMEDGFAVRVYDDGWSLIEEQTTRTTGNVGQYNFSSLLDEGNTYRVCGVQRAGYLESVPSIGQHVVNTAGGSIPSQYSDAVIVNNDSLASGEFSRCWETTLNDNNGAYLGVGYKIAAPIQTGYNVNDGDSYESPRDPNEIACSGGSTNINGVSIHWTDIGNGNPSIKYQRQYSVGAGSWTGNEIYTSPYTNYRSFGGGSGNENIYGSRVRAWLDSNDNSAVDANEAVSEWSNACDITYDVTAPAIPTGLQRLSRDDHNVVFACGDVAQLQSMHPDWDDNTEDDFDYYEYSSFNAPNGSVGIDERRFDDSIFEYMGSWLPNEGTYGFAVRAVDKTGNKSSWATGGTETFEDSCQITYDSTAPVATIDSIKYSNGTEEPSKFVTNYNDPVILGTASDNNSVASVKLSVNGYDYVATLVGSDWEANVTDVIPDGLYDMTVAVTDIAGNVTNKIQSIRIDTSAPTVAHTFYKDGVAITDSIAYGQTLGQFTFTGEYSDLVPSSNLYWDSYVIFEAQDDGSFRFSQNGKQAFCSWRSTPNLVDISGGSTFSLITPEAFTNCEASLSDGEYYMAHHVYDTATRKDIPSINQFRDVLGLHFVVDTVDPVSTIKTFNLANGGETQTSVFDGLVEGTATDGSGIDHVLLSISHLDFGADESETKYWDATGSAWVNTTSTFRANGTTSWDYQLSDVPEGIYNVTSHAVDLAGNVENTYTIRIVYDKTIPEVVLTIDPTSPDGNNGWYKTNPSITLTASDNYSLDHIEYQWNSTASSWTTYSVAINPPGEGQNILYYRSIDTVGNVSDLGIKEVKYDTTAPVESPLSVRVENIGSTTATGKWEKPENADDIHEYRLSWRHKETGEEHSATVDSNIFEHELDSLSDGLWEFKVFAVDSAGNSKSASTDFRVGPEPEVLGVTTESQPETFVGVLGQVAGVFSNNQVSDETETEKDGSSEEKVVAEDGQVAGVSDDICGVWESYLPLILLILQVVLLLATEIMNREASLKKILMMMGLSLLTIAVFYFLKKPECYTDGSAMDFINKWFVMISLGLSILIKFAASISIEDK